MYSQLSLALHFGPLAVGNLLLLPFYPFVFVCTQPLLLCLFIYVLLHGSAQCFRVHSNSLH